MYTEPVLQTSLKPYIHVITRIYQYISMAKHLLGYMDEVV